MIYIPHTKIFFWFPTNEVDLVNQTVLVSRLVLVFLNHPYDVARIGFLQNGSIGK